MNRMLPTVLGLCAFAAALLWWTVGRDAPTRPAVTHAEATNRAERAAKRPDMTKSGDGMPDARRPGNTTQAGDGVTGTGNRRLDEIRRRIFSGETTGKSLRKAFFELAERDDPEAVALLREAAGSSDPKLRALAALALGRSRAGDSEITGILRSLLQDASPHVVAMAIRGLSSRDIETLRQWGLPALEAGVLPADVEAELVITLAAAGDERAVDIAFQAAVDGRDIRFLSTVLNDVQRLPADVAIPLAQAVLKSEQADAETRGRALEALATVDNPEAARQLMGYITENADRNTRRRAAEAFSSMVDAEIPSREVASALSREPDPVVRTHLYDAILALQNPAPDQLLPVIRQERDPEARVMALFAAGTLCGLGQAHDDMRMFFDAEGVSELEREAFNQGHPANIRLRAVSALRNAATRPALAALERLKKSDDPLLRAAASRPLPRATRQIDSPTAGSHE